MSWLYWAAPLRLCNYYLVDQQKELSLILLAGAVAAAVSFAIPAFVSRPATGRSTS